MTNDDDHGELLITPAGEPGVCVTTLVTASVHTTQHLLRTSDFGETASETPNRQVQGTQQQHDDDEQKHDDEQQQHDDEQKHDEHDDDEHKQQHEQQPSPG